MVFITGGKTPQRLQQEEETNIEGNGARMTGILCGVLNLIKSIVERRPRGPDLGAWRAKDSGLRKRLPKSKASFESAWHAGLGDRKSY